MRLRYPVPANGADFERLCLRLLQRFWKCETLEIYGRSGEQQDGVDIVDTSGSRPLRAAQCKLREPHRSITPAEIVAEVDKARRFQLPIERYAILTTAKSSTAAQRKVTEINQSHADSGGFNLELITWDRLQDLLDEYSDVKDEFFSSISSQALTAVKDEVVGMRNQLGDLARTVQSSSDVDIEQARHALDQHDYQLARVLAQRVRHQRWQQIGLQDKTRVLNVIGLAYAMEGESAKAMAAFEEAYALNSEDEKVACNRAFGLLIAGQRNDARRAAEDLRKRFPFSLQATALWINSLPEDYPLEEIKSSVEKSKLQHPEVAIAVARRALAARDYELAQQLARSATIAEKPWSTSWLVLAQALVSEQLASGQPSQERLTEAEACLTRALELSVSEKSTEGQVEVLLNRAHIHWFVNNPTGQRKDVEQAIRLMPDNPAALRDYGELLAAKGNLDAAVESLERAVARADRPDTLFSLANLLARRGTGNDTQRAANAFIRAASNAGSFPLGFREFLLMRALDVVARLDKKESYEAEIKPVLERMPEFSRIVIQGKLAFIKGDNVPAHGFADEIVRRIEEGSSEQLEHAAAFLSELGRYADALPVFQKLFVPNALVVNARPLLECAHRLKKEDVILQVCRSLRHRSSYDLQLLHYEVDLLESYNYEEAIKALQEYLQLHPEDKIVRLRLSNIGLKFGFSELVSGRIEDIPPVDSLPVHYALAAVQILKFTKQGVAALRYAYQLLRLHFGEPDAHRAMFMALGPFGEQVEITQPSTVQPGTAVGFKEELEQTERWVVIEDEYPADPRLDEIPPNSSLANAMIGKTPGSKFSLAERAVDPRQAEIVGILNKYVFRYQRSLSDWQIRFPENPVVQSMKITQEPATGQPNLQPILKAIEGRFEHIQKLKEMYAEQPISVHMFSEGAGHDAVDGLEFLAHDDEAQIKCCAGSIDERTQALDALKKADAIVLDITAITTMSMLGLLTKLSNLGKTFVVDPATIGLLREKAAKQKLMAAKGGTLTKTDRGFTMLHKTVEDEIRVAERIEETYRELSRTTTIPSGAPLAGIDPEMRDLMIKVFAEHGAQSILRATKPGSVLWSDDQVLAGFASHEFGVRRVWTQVFLENAMHLGYLDPEAYASASAKLVGYRYQFTSVSAQVVACAGDMADWNPDEFPLRRVLDHFRNSDLSIQSFINLTIFTLLELHKTMRVIDASGATVTRLFSYVAERAEGKLLLERLLTALPQLFSVNQLGMDRAAQRLKAWLTGSVIKTT